MDSSLTIKLTLAAVVVVLIVVLFLLYRSYESLIGSGLAQNQSGVIGGLTAGATIRRLGTEFSQPGQGEHTTVYIPEIQEAMPQALRSNESLVGFRDGPDFWATGSLLRDYQRGTSQQLMKEKQAEQSKQENLDKDSVVARARDAKLMEILYE